ncbi:hypothetical protein WQE_14841 [Paraburkholderia hospita]|uniref:Uncharacterized protein n=1 Tax=Paraburkholderia hospita TaxID=169430 RepID=A0ABN0FNI3_9BURK|nr:hypothetical protein WQE_14841 [Paraburkholderia hospita]OUL69966.1 hypothetical protein CA601_48165 [Paraburkholderia hospita]
MMLRRGWYQAREAVRCRARRAARDACKWKSLRQRRTLRERPKASMPSAKHGGQRAVLRVMRDFA